MQHRPRRLIGADLQGALQAQRRDPVLLGRKHPARRKPHRQRRACAIKDRARRRRGPRTTRGAHQPPISTPPALRMPAPEAHKPRRPAQPLQVVAAVRIRRKPRRELPQRPRAMNTSNRPLRHPTMLLRLDGYPIEALSSMKLLCPERGPARPRSAARCSRGVKPRRLRGANPTSESDSARLSRWLLRNPRESRCRGNRPSPRACASGRAGRPMARAPSMPKIAPAYSFHGESSRTAPGGPMFVAA